MLSARSTHYWLWFVLFGVLPSAVIWRTRGVFDSETFWLLAIGFLGVLVGSGQLGARFSRPYDLIVGLLFLAVGVLGMLHDLGYSLIPADSSAINTANTINQTAVLGLSLVLPYALIHTLLGLTSLSHGLRAPASSASASAETHRRAA